MSGIDNKAVLTQIRRNLIDQMLADIEKGIEHLMVLGNVPAVAAVKKQPQTQAEKEKEMLRGPQLDKDKPSQDDIDKLFANS